MERKSLYDISWKVDESTYRADPALSYSTLARYEREGFNNLEYLFDKLETPSLTFGSAVDALITGGQEEFDKEFMVADFPPVPDSIVTIVKELFQWCHSTNRTLESIEDDFIIEMASKYNYQNNWKPETRAKVIKEKGAEYYKLLYVAGGRAILDTGTYQDICNAVKALKESEATKFYFAENNPFEPDIERFYQLKFKGEFENIPVRCMLDEIIVNHKDKTILPIDLKTTKSVITFNHSFYQWGYFIQAQLYTYILEQNIKNDDYFKDFKILNYKFIAVDKYLLLPIVFNYEGNHSMTSLIDNDGKERKSWRILLKELNYYLTHSECKLPLEMWNEFKKRNGEINIK